MDVLAHLCAVDTAVRDHLSLGDCTDDQTLDVHSHRRHAIATLQAYLDALVSALQSHVRGASLPDGDGGIADESARRVLLAHLLFLPVGWCLTHIGTTLIACQDTSLGYKWLLAGFRTVKCQRRGTAPTNALPQHLATLAQLLTDVEAMVAGLRGEGQTKPGAAAVFSTAVPPTSADVDFATPSDRLTCGASAVLIRPLIVMAQLWARWGEPAAALAMLQAAVKELSDDRRLEVAKASIVASHVTSYERSQQLRALEQQEQQEQQKAKLAARLQRRRASLGGESPPAAPEQSTDVATPRAKGPVSPPSVAAAAIGEGLLTTAELADLLAHLAPLQCLTSTIPAALQAAAASAPSPDKAQALPIAAVLQALSHGILDDGESLRAERVATLNCMAQIHKSTTSGNALAESAYFCHLALSERLACSKDRYNLVEWVDACVALCEWYLLVRDLSHLQACADAAAAMLAWVARHRDRHPAAAACDADAFHELSMRLQFFQMMHAGYTLQLFQRSNARRREAADESFQTSQDTSPAILEPLFNNEIIPPVDACSGSVEAESRNRAVQRESSSTSAQETGTAGSSSVGVWVIPARITFPGHPAPLLAIQVPVMGVDGSEDVALRWFHRFATLRLAVLQFASLDDNCEEFLDLQRQTADVCATLHQYFPDNVLWLVWRSAILKDLLAFNLNKNAFRNVLRQAQYDCGATCVALGKMAFAETDSRTLQVLPAELTAGQMDADVEEKLRQSLAAHPAQSSAFALFAEGRQFYASFAQAFELEAAQAEAIRKQTADIFEESDYPAYILGLMQLALTELLCARATTPPATPPASEFRQRAVTVLETCRRFIEQHQTFLLAHYPDTTQHDAQCRDLLALLQGVASSGSAAAALELPTTGSGGGGGTSRGAHRHVDVAPAAVQGGPRPLATGRRILAKPLTKK